MLNCIVTATTARVSSLIASFTSSEPSAIASIRIRRDFVTLDSLSFVPFAAAIGSSSACTSFAFAIINSSSLHPSVDSLVDVDCTQACYTKELGLVSILPSTLALKMGRRFKLDFRQDLKEDLG